MHRIKGKHVTNCYGEIKVKQKQNFTQVKDKKTLKSHFGEFN
jgi:hypothetical protein